MKKFFITLTMLAVAAGASAQESDVVVPKRHYINLAFANQSLKFGAAGGVDAFTLKSDNGAAMEFGSTFFFNGRRPVADMVRFGLDFSYLDLQYASFKIGEGSEALDAHFGNIGMQIGPSVTVTPMDRLHARAYVHYAPSAAAFSPSDFEEIKFGYAGYVTGGVQVSYRFLTLGVEMRSASAKFSSVDTEDIDNIENVGDVLGPKVTTKLPGMRFIVGFRF